MYHQSKHVHPWHWNPHRNSCSLSVLAFHFWCNKVGWVLQPWAWACSPCASCIQVLTCTAMIWFHYWCQWCVDSFVCVAMLKAKDERCKFLKVPGGSCTTWCFSTCFFVKQNKVRFAFQRLKGRFQQLACFGTAFFVRCKWTHYSLDGEEIGGGGEISVCAYLFGWLLFLCGAYWICNVARLEMISIEILSKKIR